jgi:Mn-containing catalase
VADRDKQCAVDGGSGEATVQMPNAAVDVLKRMAARTESNPQAQPMTGADLGSGQAMSGAGAAAPEAAMAGRQGGAGAGGSAGAQGGSPNTGGSTSGGGVPGKPGKPKP